MIFQHDVNHLDFMCLENEIRALTLTKFMKGFKIICTDNLSYFSNFSSLHEIVVVKSEFVENKF